MTKLSVNVNKLATLRNSRGKNNPDLIKSVIDIVAYGAQGITVHPRPDGRHIRHADVYRIAKIIEVEFNIEGFPDEQYMQLIKTVKPTQCTLVPDPPQALTSDAGWQLTNNLDFLSETVKKIQDLGIRSSLFIDPFMLSSQELEALEKISSDRVELYTEAYANAFDTDKAPFVLAAYKKAAKELNELNIELNAGHDLNLLNLKTFVQAIPSIQEVSIGHALICDALYFGLKQTISCYLNCLQTDG